MFFNRKHFDCTIIYYTNKLYELQPFKENNYKKVLYMK